ncbi:MAG: T9SS type A sorting domain-containing protein [Prolixibacteraceae bacterium]|nr:T9SS type A sorting domain-containing protein [Prolixibacteraceae bacterium]
MKKNLHFLLLAVILAFLFISGTMNNSGSPGAKTGSPLDGANCTQCHTGGSTSEVSWISSSIPESGWIPGETYTLTINASHGSAKKIGFEITAENGTSKTGTFSLIDQSRTKLSNSNRAVTHTFAGNATTNGENSWELNWKAPDTAEGDITFYAAFNLANGDGTTNGDEIALSTLVVPVSSSTAVIEHSVNRLLVFPNPAVNRVNIKAPSEMQELVVYNAAGLRVRSYEHLNSSTHHFDLNGFTPGIYFLKALTGEGEIVHRIQKQ